MIYLYPISVCRGTNTVDEYQTIDELLEAMDLSDEEMLMHRTLIDACRENERKLSEYYISTKRNMDRLCVVIDTMTDRIAVLSTALSDLLCESETMSLRTMSEDKFFRE